MLGQVEGFCEHSVPAGFVQHQVGQRMVDPVHALHPEAQTLLAQIPWRPACTRLGCCFAHPHKPARAPAESGRRKPAGTETLGIKNVWQFHARYRKAKPRALGSRRTEPETEGEIFRMFVQ